MVKQAFEKNIKTIQDTAETCSKEIELAIKLIEKCLKNKNKILLCGNGGSAAQSQHIAAEFVGRFMMERKALPAIALTTDTSILTAVGNDYGSDAVFERQVEALGSKGDVLIAISTSGNSPNIIKALKKAKDIGVKTIGLSGKNGGKMKGCDVDIIVPSEHTPNIQEAHITILHIICELVEKELF